MRLLLSSGYRKNLLPSHGYRLRRIVMSVLHDKQILLGVSGSIAAYKVPFYRTIAC